MIVGSAYTPDHAVAVVVVNSHAYVADEHSGIQIFDALTPSSPPVIGRVAMDGSAIGIAVQGSHAYIAVFPRGLRVVDISDPAAPQVIAWIASPTGLRAEDVAITGSLVCVVNTPSGDYETGILQVIDVSDPDAPHVVGEVETYGYALGVDCDGRFAYVADYGSVLVVDLSDAKLPIVGSAGFGYAYDAKVVGPRLYVVGQSGFAIFDISSAPSLVYLGSAHTPGLSHAIAVNGNYAYVACDQDGMAIVDVSEPTAPVIVRQVATRDRAMDVVVSGSNAYVADGWSGLQVVDITNPSGAEVIGGRHELYGTSSVAMTEGREYVLAGGPHLSILPTQCPMVQAVELSSLAATGVPGAVLVTWSTSLESDHLGFNILRIFDDRSYKRLNPGLIKPPGPYRFLDTDVRPGVTYFYRLEAVDRRGGSEFFGPVQATAMMDPRAPRFVLSQSQPNPFVAEVGATVIGFTLESQIHTKLRVFDASGRLVRVLVDEPLGAGAHVARWDGRNDGGTEVGSGIYYYRLEGGDFSEARALVKVR